MTSIVIARKGDIEAYAPMQLSDSHCTDSHPLRAEPMS